MAKAPRCKICRVEHWGAEHVFVTKGVTKGVTKQALARYEMVAAALPVTKPRRYRPPTTGPQPPPGRPKVYASNAERQKAYRERIKKADPVSEVTPERGSASRPVALPNVDLVAPT